MTHETDAPSFSSYMTPCTHLCRPAVGNYEPTNAAPKPTDASKVDTTSDITHKCVAGLLWTVIAKVVGNSTAEEEAEAKRTTIWLDVHWVRHNPDRLMSVLTDLVDSFTSFHST